MLERAVFLLFQFLAAGCFIFLSNLTFNQIIMRKRRRGIVLILLFFFCLSSEISFAQQIPFSFKHLTIDEGLSNNTVYSIIQDKNGHYRVKASTEIEDFNGYFNVNFSNEEFSTIGGLIIHAFGHLPKRDEKITFEGFKITILRADSRKLYSVLLEIDSPSNSV